MCTCKCVPFWRLDTKPLNSNFLWCLKSFFPYATFRIVIIFVVFWSSWFISSASIHFWMPVYVDFRFWKKKTSINESIRENYFFLCAFHTRHNNKPWSRSFYSFLHSATNSSNEKCRSSFTEAWKISYESLDGLRIFHFIRGTLNSPMID